MHAWENNESVCVNEEGCGMGEGPQHLHGTKGRNKQERDADRFFVQGLDVASEKVDLRQRRGKKQVLFQ